MNELTTSPLGKATVYKDQYDPQLLFAIHRDGNRIKIGIDTNKLPFLGVDIWNGFDFTWLDKNGHPQFGLVTIVIPADSPNLVESKSLKLYLFSFANTKFSNPKEIIEILKKDISLCSGGAVKIILEDKKNSCNKIYPRFSGHNLDTLDVSCNDVEVNSELLKFDENTVVTEELCSDLLKSNCLVTGKPDWGSVKITYTGPKIDGPGLLKYIISYRNHQGFHEQCIEKIFYDILIHGNPEKLIVEGRYTRRGGLDINPVRSNVKIRFKNERLLRQ